MDLHRWDPRRLTHSECQAPHAAGHLCAAEDGEGEATGLRTVAVDAPLMTTEVSATFEAVHKMGAGDAMTGIEETGIPMRMHDGIPETIVIEGTASCSGPNSKHVQPMLKMHRPRPKRSRPHPLHLLLPHLARYRTAIKDRGMVQQMLVVQANHRPRPQEHLVSGHHLVQNHLPCQPAPPGTLFRTTQRYLVDHGRRFQRLNGHQANSGSTRVSRSPTRQC
jgi:hypothetical protein